MLESSTLQMGRCGYNGGTAKSKRYRSRPKIKRWKHHFEHSLETFAVIGELELEGHLAVIQHDRGGSVCP